MHQLNHIKEVTGYRVSKHAWRRMSGRSVSPRALDAVVRYGRVARVRGADIHVIGRREVRKYRKHGLDLTPYEGLQVVCGPDAIITTYRNHNLRGLKPRRPRRARRWHR